MHQVAGRRTVPVEVGTHYLAEGWGTRLMTLDAFIAGMAAPTAPAAGQQQRQQRQQQPGAGSDAGASAAARAGAAAHAAGGGGQQQQQQPQQRQLLYLAQHQLFEQVPALAADIVTPDYCSLGERGGVSAVNAWFGPAGTVTPLHQDPEHNLLAQVRLCAPCMARCGRAAATTLKCVQAPPRADTTPCRRRTQVVGTKYVRLFDPCHTARLYPHGQGMHTNTSQVDVESVDAARFPLFAGAPHVDAVLRPGDMLYMPPRWWHFVKATSLSFSVSFWWS
jgi:lysine-specific demethylase 8